MGIPPPGAGRAGQGHGDQRGPAEPQRTRTAYRLRRRGDRPGERAGQPESSRSGAQLQHRHLGSAARDQQRRRGKQAMRKHHNLAIAVAMAALASSPWRVLNRAAGMPELQAEHWYSIRAAGEEQSKVIEVFIYGEIGFWGVTSGDFIRDLQEQDDGVSPVLVRFDTIGGDLFDGIAIHNTLRGLGERCTSRIDGACWSAGSVAACGAHRVEMADNTLMMIHNPWTWMAGGSEELRKTADMLDKAREAILASYQHRALTID